MRAMIYLLSLTAALFTGCATQPQKKSQDSTAMAAKGDAKYVQGMQVTSVRSMGRNASCPRQINSVKGLNWQRTVALANACVQASQWNMVEQIGQHLAQTEHLGPWGAYYLSLAAEQRQDYPRAMWMIELALKKAPQLPALIYQQGRIQWLVRDQASAVASLKKAVELDSGLTDAHMILGQLALADNNLNEAKKRFELALVTEPRLFAALMGVAEVGIRRKDGKLAGEHLAQAVLHYPGSGRARVKQAEVLEQLDKNFPEALAAYKRLKSLSQEGKLDARLEIDVEAKIRSLEGLVKEVAPNQLSQTSPDSQPKVEK